MINIKHTKNSAFKAKNNKSTIYCGKHLPLIITSYETPNNFLRQINSQPNNFS